MSRDKLSSCGGRWLGNHGGELGERKHGHCLAREYGGDRRYVDNPDFHIWADLGRTLQHGGSVADASQGGISWSDALAYVAAHVSGGIYWRGRGTSNVRPNSPTSITSALGKPVTRVIDHHRHQYCLRAVSSPRELVGEKIDQSRGNHMATYR